MFFDQQPHPLHVDQLELDDLDPDTLSLLLFVRWPKNSQACLFLNQFPYFWFWGHVILLIEDYKTDPPELLLKVPNFDALPWAKFEKILTQYLWDVIIKSLLAKWLETQLLPKNFEGGFQIHENFHFMVTKTD